MKKKRVIDIVCFACGLVLNALGIRMIVYADIGAYPIDAVAIALCNTFGLTVGTWLNIDSIVLVLAAAVILKTKPNLYCFGVSILFGFLYDGWSIMLFDGLEAYSISPGFKVALLVLGAMINAVGASIYLCPKFPVSALDNLMVSIKERFHLSFQFSRLFMEGSLAVIAFLLKGPLGLGTVALVLIFSSILEIVHKYASYYYIRLIGDSVEL